MIPAYEQQEICRISLASARLAVCSYSYYDNTRTACVFISEVLAPDIRGVLLRVFRHRLAVLYRSSLGFVCSKLLCVVALAESFDLCRNSYYRWGHSWLASGADLYFHYLPRLRRRHVTFCSSSPPKIQFRRHISYFRLVGFFASVYQRLEAA